MKINNILLSIITIAATISFAASAPASAETAAAANPSSFGSIAPTAAAGRTITINADTKSIHITDGETVRFVSGSQSFTWNFNIGGSFIRAFDLTVLAPQGALDHKVVVYVSANPLYLG